MNLLPSFLIILLHILCICDLRAKPIVSYGGGSGSGSASMVSTATTITALPIIIAKLALASQTSDFANNNNKLQDLKVAKAKAYQSFFYSREPSAFLGSEGEQTENYAADYLSNSVHDLSSPAAISVHDYVGANSLDEFETIKMQTNNHQRPVLPSTENESNTRYYSSSGSSSTSNSGPNRLGYGGNIPDGSGQVAKFSQATGPHGRHGRPLKVTSQANSQQLTKGLYQNDLGLHYAYGLVGSKLSGLGGSSSHQLANHNYASLPNKILHYSSQNGLLSNLISQSNPNSNNKLATTPIKDQSTVSDPQQEQAVDTGGLAAVDDHSSSANAINCGRQQVGSHREPRIVGGNSTYQGEFPWAVSIQRHGNHHCGGVIVGKRWILTAAHCVRSQYVGNLVVRTGGHSLSKFNNNNNNINSHLERNYLVEQIVMHGDFSRYDNLTTSQLKSSATTNNGDIALLRLSQDIQWSELAWPVCTPTRDVGNFSGHDAVVIGWGKLTEKSEDFSNDLQKVKLTIIDNKLCQNWFRQAGRDMPIDERIICAGFKNGGKDACHGDSGGPLLSKIRGQYVVVGVVSTGIGCARPLLPGLYSRVSSYLDWIETYTAN